MTALPATNTAWGFRATIAHHADPAQAWALAVPAVAAATGCPEAAVRAFLDGRHDRHLADDVANGHHAGFGLAPAVTAAVARWVGWRIGWRMARETGIPQGLPYLTGLLTALEIEAEAA